MNIIAVVTDDQSLWSVGCYGQSDIETPHMDSLARDGAKFTNAFVNAPVCSPSRATYLTGRHASELEITDWLTGGQSKKLGLSKKFVSWPEVLRRKGYTTGLVGKWHLGSADAYKPGANGFDYFVGNLSGGWSPKKNVFVNQHGEMKEYPGFSVDITTDLALDFIEEQKEEPFALLVHYREPHAPYGPMPQQDEEKTKGLKPKLPDYPGLKPHTQKLMRDYLTAVASVDRNLGRIIDKVEELGLSENTVVMFTSDHGYNMGHHGLRFKGNGYWLVEGKNGCRPNMYESSLRVPLLVKWPKVVKPGTVIEAETANVDTFASVLGMLGVKEVPKNQGYDFSKLLRGEKVDSWREGVFGQYHMVNDAKHSMRMWRKDGWKLVRHYRVDGKDELYHLKKDPSEARNLYGNAEYARIQKELQSELDAKMEALGDDPSMKPVQAR
ncbi:sulfatase [Rubritalea tangerina]|uniref:Sulfatase n=2 Tax=Rubritalea tangerina TaxID=430798 RepID=A0ABW4Z8Z7_9BACT